jgi:hypothetical protein
MEFAGFRRIPGETIQTKKRYVTTLIGTGERVDDIKKINRFAEAFTDVTVSPSTKQKRGIKLELSLVNSPRY